MYTAALHHQVELCIIRLKKILKAQINSISKCLRFPSLILLLHYLLSQPTTIFYDLMTSEEKKNLSLLYRECCMIWWHYPKINSCNTIVPFISGPEKIVVKGNPPGGQNFRQCTQWFVCLEEEMTTNADLH